MCNALTVTKRESAPLPERLCERIAYCAILLTVYEADYSVVVAQSEGADHRYYSTPEMQNILLQNAVGHAVRKAKNFAGGATDAILSGRQVLTNLMSDFVLDKTKATAEGHQWESYILERITNNARFAAGGQCVRFAPMTPGLTEGHYGEYAGLLVGSQLFGSIHFLRSMYSWDGTPHFLGICWLKKLSSKKEWFFFDVVCFCCMFFFCMFHSPLTALRQSSSHYGADGYLCSLPLPRCRVVSACFFASSANLSISVGERSSDALSILARPSLTVIFLGSLIITYASLWLLLVKTTTEQRITGKKSRWSYSCSLALRRWRRLISSRIFLGKKPAGLFSGRESLLSVCFSVIHQPLGSMPRRFSSVRPNSLSQLARLTPSLLASRSNCSFSSGAIRIWKGGAFPVPLGFLSRLIIVDMCTPIALCFHSIGVHINTYAFNNATPRSAGTHAGRLTTNDSRSIEVAMRNHTTHPQGRDLHNLNKYTWRFIALSTVQPRVITIEATSEQEARQQSPDGCVMVFAARIRQEVEHV